MEYGESTAKFMTTHQFLLPRTGDFTERFIEEYHQKTLHERVQATMCSIRERFWIPKLTSAVNHVIYNCN